MIYECKNDDFAVFTKNSLDDILDCRGSGGEKPLLDFWANIW